MQPNTITVPVDTLNDGTAIINEVYSRFEEFLNRSKYIGENHSLAMRDEVTLYRTLPKQAGNSKGIAKSAVKMTLDVTVPGVDPATSVTAPFIIEISAAIPVGTPVDVTKRGRQRAIGFVDQDAIMSPLNDQLMV